MTPRHLAPEPRDYEDALEAARQLANLPHPESTEFTISETWRLCAVIKWCVGTEEGVGEKIAVLLHCARSPAFLDAHWMSFQHERSSLRMILENRKRGLA